MTELRVYLRALQDPSYDEDWTVGWQSVVMLVAHQSWDDDRLWRDEGVFADG